MLFKSCTFSKKTCLQEWPMASSWEMSSKTLRILYLVRSVVCLRPWAMQYQFGQAVCTNNIIYDECLFFHWGSGVWVGQSCWHYMPPWLTINKNPGHQGSGEFPWLATFLHVLSHILAQRIKCIHATPLGKNFWKLIPGFSWTLPHLLFSDFNVYPFTAINYNHKYNSFLESHGSF